MTDPDMTLLPVPTEVVRAFQNDLGRIRTKGRTGLEQVYGMEHVSEGEILLPLQP